MRLCDYPDAVGIVREVAEETGFDESEVVRIAEAILMRLKGSPTFQQAMFVVMVRQHYTDWNLPIVRDSFIALLNAVERDRAIDSQAVENLLRAL